MRVSPAHDVIPHVFMLFCWVHSDNVGVWLTVCAGVQQLSDQIRQVLKSSGSTTFSKIVNKWNGHRSPSPYTQTSQSIPTFGTKTYGYGGSHPRPPSPSRSRTSQLPTEINLFCVCLALALPHRALVCGSESFPAFFLSCVPSFSFIFILTPPLQPRRLFR